MRKHPQSYSTDIALHLLNTSIKDLNWTMKSMGTGGLESMQSIRKHTNKWSKEFFEKTLYSKPFCTYFCNWLFLSLRSGGTSYAVLWFMTYVSFLIQFFGCFFCLFFFFYGKMPSKDI